MCCSTLSLSSHPLTCKHMSVTPTRTAMHNDRGSEGIPVLEDVQFPVDVLNPLDAGMGVVGNSVVRPRDVVVLDNRSFGGGLKGRG